MRRLVISLPEKQYKSLKKQAARWNVSMAAWIRLLITIAKDRDDKKKKGD